MFEEYGLNETVFQSWKGNPIDNLQEYFSFEIPTLLVAGDSDEVVNYERNAGLMIDYCKAYGVKLESYVKPGCKHHPHSLEEVMPIIQFVENNDYDK